MTTVTLGEATPARRVVRSVSVAGVHWPLHKALAVVAAVVMAVLVGVLTRSGEVTTWAAVAASVVVWWGVKLASLRAATD